VAAVLAFGRAEVAEAAGGLYYSPDDPLSQASYFT
jgi:hypothetical protein